MGVPKFFRWLSERYPLINQRLDESAAPEFDNLYLDMNGIIHHCSHPNDDSTQNVLTQAEIFASVFHYIDRLFHIVKPRKLFYLAIDGCAPRAKMNQQRQRRFRTARDSAEALEANIAKGIMPPSSKPFDSNCITPGTDFMATLSVYIKFFIQKKITEDSRWSKVRVIFSGHDAPGEGEHKIMEYIRHMKAQPDWDPNVSHCLYGLDADLIMLGLASHEPNFALLREEVINKQRSKNTKITGETSLDTLEFHLLHLCLVREYLDLEFRNIKLSFEYSLERIIDDFILMCFFVGNDFLPSLPTMDVADGGLNGLLAVYKLLLAEMDGYITNGADIDFPRLEKLMVKMGVVEKQITIGLPTALEETMALRKQSELDEEDEDEQADAAFQSKLELLQSGVDSLALSRSGDSVNNSAIARVQAHFNLRESNDSEAGDEDSHWKDAYYREKFEIQSQSSGEDDSKVRTFHHRLRQSYLEGLVWVLNYYNRGCVSWEWFYPFHFAPLCSDMTKLNELQVSFNLATPFLPYQQLLGVLPAASAECLPAAYRPLMTSSDSPIADFYPTDFKTDMAGKRNAWEAIVLIPFIDQTRLLDAIAKVDTSSLTEEERNRNKHGPAVLFQRSASSTGSVPAPSASLAPIERSQCSYSAFQLPEIPKSVKNVFVLCPGAKMGLSAPSGYPTLKTLTFQVEPRFAGVNVFGGPSRQETICLKFAPLQDPSAENIAKDLIGKKLYVNWPYLREAIVAGVSDAAVKWAPRYHPNNPRAQAGELQSVPHAGEYVGYWAKDADHLRFKALNKRGIDIQAAPIILHVRMLDGIDSRAINSNGSKSKRFSNVEEMVPMQLTAPLSVVEADSRFLENGPLEVSARFPVGCSVLYTGPKHTGNVGKVVAVVDNKLTIDLDVVQNDLKFGHAAISKYRDKYFPLHIVARQLNVPTKVIAKVTASAYFEPGHFNLGLNIKFSGKSLQVPGYTRRVENGDGSTTWEFSQRAISLIAEYQQKYPRVFTLLEQDMEHYNVFDLLDGPDSSDKRTAAGSFAHTIRKYLGDMPTKSLGKVPCGSESVSEAGIKFIEQYSAKLAENPVTVTQITAVDPAVAVLPYSLDDRILPKAPSTERNARREETVFEHNFMLGDRVASILDNSQIPFGALGTVVELVGRHASVLFDKSYLGANNLQSTCSDFRGLRIDMLGLFNLQQNQPRLNNSGSHIQTQSSRPVSRQERGERSDRFDRSDRSDRFERSDRSERPDRPDKFDRHDRGDRSDRGDRPDRERSDRPDTRAKPSAVPVSVMRSPQVGSPQPKGPQLQGFSSARSTTAPLSAQPRPLSNSQNDQKPEKQAQPATNQQSSASPVTRPPQVAAPVTQSPGAAASTAEDMEQFWNKLQTIQQGSSKTGPTQSTTSSSSATAPLPQTQSPQLPHSQPQPAPSNWVSEEQPSQGKSEPLALNWQQQELLDRQNRKQNRKAKTAEARNQPAKQPTAQNSAPKVQSEAEGQTQPQLQAQTQNQAQGRGPKGPKGPKGTKGPKNQSKEQVPSAPVQAEANQNQNQVQAQPQPPVSDQKQQPGGQERKPKKQDRKQNKQQKDVPSPAPAVASGEANQNQPAPVPQADAKAPAKRNERKTKTSRQQDGVQQGTQVYVVKQDAGAHKNKDAQQPNNAEAAPQSVAQSAPQAAAPRAAQQPRQVQQQSQQPQVQQQSQQPQVRQAPKKQHNDQRSDQYQQQQQTHFPPPEANYPIAPPPMMMPVFPVVHHQGYEQGFYQPEYYQQPMPMYHQPMQPQYPGYVQYGYPDPQNYGAEYYDNQTPTGGLTWQQQELFQERGQHYGQRGGRGRGRGGRRY